MDERLVGAYGDLCGPLNATPVVVAAYWLTVAPRRVCGWQLARRVAEQHMPVCVIRGFTGGASFDQIMARQLGQQLDEKLDLYVLNQVISAGASVSGASSWTNVGTLYQDVAKGREQSTDTAGVRLRPTHFFSSSDFYSYVTRQVDSSGRPLVVPEFAPGFPIFTGADDGLQSDKSKPKWSRFTGTGCPAACCGSRMT